MRQSRSHLHFSVPHIALLVLILPVLFSCSSNEVENLQADTVEPERELVVDWPYPCQQEKIPEYTVYRAGSPIQIDGKLDDKAWQDVPLSPRFIDLISGEAPIHDTHVKLLWDDEALYVGFLIEEPVINGTLTERNDPLYNENNAEVFIAGKDAYYEFEINALGTLYEAFFIWKEAYDRGGFAENPAFTLDNPLLQEFNGVGWKEHPRGLRVGSWDFWFPGLESAVFIDGEINNDEIRDRGWYVELAFPWHGMEWLAKADQRALPPLDGDTWRIDFSRFNPYKAAPPANDSGGWSLSSHGIWDSHIPECFPYIHFRDEPVPS